MRLKVFVLAVQIPVDLLDCDLDENRVVVVKTLEEYRTDLGKKEKNNYYVVIGRKLYVLIKQTFAMLRLST